MKKSRFTEEQILGILKQVEGGRTIADVCREHGISDATYHRWKGKYGGLEVSQLRRLKQLEEENRRLKQIVGELTLDNAALKDVVAKKMVTPAARQELVAYLQEHHQLSQRRACRLAQAPRATIRYQSCRASQEPLRARLRELAQARPRFGYRRLTVLLRREQGALNHKRVYRLYRLEGLAVRRRGRKRVARAARVAPAATPQLGQHWAMDFMQDSLASGRPFRTLNIVDLASRECLAIEVDTSLPGARVVRVLVRLCAQHGRPRAITMDNGPEFAGLALDTWAYREGVQLDFIEPGRPMQNGHLESFNGKFRDECLNQHWFTDLDDARDTIVAWKDDYNTVRPHSALGNLTPDDFARRLRQPGVLSA